MVALNDIKHYQDISIENQSEIRVALFGVDDNTCKALNIVFGNTKELKAQIIRSGNADMALFDFDNSEDSMSWQNYRLLNPELPTIVFGSINPELENITYLSKPIGVSKLKVALAHVRQKCIPKGHSVARDISVLQTVATNVVPLSSTHVLRDVVKPDIVNRKNINEQANNKVLPNGDGISAKDKDHPELTTRKLATDAAYYDPEKYLQQLFHKTHQTSTNKGRAAVLSVQTDGELVSVTFLPNKKLVIIDVDKSIFRRISTVPLACVKYKIYTHNSTQTEQLESHDIDDKLCFSIDNFLWSTAIWISNGRLPIGTDVNKAVQLRRWPNLTRLTTIPHAFSLSALFTGKPISIKSVERVLGVSIKEVYAFYSAASALGIIINMKDSARGNDDLISPKKSSNHSLFSNIINKFLNR